MVLKPFERFRKDVKISDLVRIVFGDYEIVGYIDLAIWESERNSPQSLDYIKPHIELSDRAPPSSAGIRFDIDYLEKNVKGYEVLRRQPQNPSNSQPSKTP